MTALRNPRTDEAARWLLLVHQLPGKPAYPRVKVWRRLQALGAVTLRNAVYALPASEQTREDLEWVLKEVVEGGGEGMVCEARLVDGLSDQEVRALFNKAREADYDAVAKAARELREALAGKDDAAGRSDARARLARLRQEAAKVTAIDFFGANGREAVEGLLASLDALLREEEMMGEPEEGALSATDEIGPLAGRVWVTRQGVYVDRIASAWLVRRFIDPEARFKFVPARGYAPEPGELRFDMFEAEFTHEGDRCTFEVLLARTGLADPALTAIAEIVHDIDLKDGKFGREETSGIAHLITGLTMTNSEDERRIERGAAVLDDLYEYFRRKPGQPAE
jgi:hypothetical protein